MKHAKPSPKMVLAAYAERLLEGRRVVVFGDSTSGLAEHLVERGARLVHVYDTDPGRVARATTEGASRNISFAPLGQGGIAARDGAFDIGIVENLAKAADAAGTIRRMRRALAARGIAFIVTPNVDVKNRMLPDGTKTGPSYYELYDLAGGEFDEVRMLGQTPFVGYAVAEFSEEASDEYAIDTGFVPGGAEEPEYYVALASHFPVSLDAFCVVQLPAEAILAKSDAGAGAVPQVDSLRRQLAAVERELLEAKGQGPKTDGQSKQLLQRANDELTRRDDWVAELESRAAVADERADDAEAELEPLRLEVDQLKQALKVAKQQAAEQARAVEQEGKKQLSAAQQEFQQQLQARDKEAQTQRGAPKRAPATTQDPSADSKKADEMLARQAELYRRKLEAAAKETGELKRALSEAHRELRQHSQAEEQQQEEAQKKKRQQEQQQQRRGQAEASAEDHGSAAKEVETLRARVKELLSQLTDSRKQLEEAIAANRDLSRDLADLEAQLRERGSEVARLCTALSKTENFGEQLLRELEQARSPSSEEEDGAATTTSAQPSSETSAKLKDTLDALAATNARSVADLAAAQWTIQELESKLKSAGVPNGSDVLSELERARAEIQRQSTLLQQFRDKAQA